MTIQEYRSNSGEHFRKLPEEALTVKNCDFVEAQNHPGDVEAQLINLYPEVHYQTYGGIGGAFSEAAALAWSKLSPAKQDAVIRALFDPEEGIGYNFGRLSINSCDFSAEDYTYVKEGDMTLESFDISHDEIAVFPMVRAAMKYNDLTLFASPWSPPAYMKTNGNRIGGHLREDCYELWAAYFGKYADACAEHGVPLWGVTMQNEPRHHQIWESCLYSTEEEERFLGYLGPVLEPRNVKILCYDHCRERAFERLDHMTKGPNSAYLSGVAHHWYSGDHFGTLDAIRSSYPDMISIASESCTGVPEEGIHEKYELATAEKFAHDMLGCFAHGLHYYCDWNLVLDEKNGPCHNREGRGLWVDALVYCDGSRDDYVLRLGYYYMGHVSKFVKPNAHVVASSSYDCTLEHCAFENPDGSLVLVVLNRRDEPLSYIVRWNDGISERNLPAHSIATLILKK